MFRSAGERGGRGERVRGDAESGQEQQQEHTRHQRCLTVIFYLYLYLSLSNFHSLSQSCKLHSHHRSNITIFPLLNNIVSIFENLSRNNNPNPNNRFIAHNEYNSTIGLILYFSCCNLTLKNN